MAKAFISQQEVLEGYQPIPICVSFGKSHQTHGPAFSKCNLKYPNKMSKAFSSSSLSKCFFVPIQQDHNRWNVSLALTYWSLFVHFFFFLSLALHNEHLSNIFLFSIHVAPITSILWRCCRHNLVEYTAFWQKALMKTESDNTTNGAGQCDFQAF